MTQLVQGTLTLAISAKTDDKNGAEALKRVSELLHNFNLQLSKLSLGLHSVEVHDHDLEWESVTEVEDEEINKTTEKLNGLKQK